MRAPAVDEQVAYVEVEQACRSRRELLLGCLAALLCQLWALTEFPRTAIK